MLRRGGDALPVHRCRTVTAGGRVTTPLHLRHDPRAPRKRGGPPVPPLGRDYAEGPCTVLAVVDRYPPKVNAGAEWMLHAMLRDLAQNGHDVHVATGCTDTAYDLEGVTVWPVTRGDQAVLDTLADLIRPEAIISHLLWTKEARVFAGRHNLPVLYVVHNHTQPRAWNITRRGRDVSALIWNSEWIAAECSQDRDLQGIPATVIRPPLICDDYRVPRPDADRITLVNPIAAKGSRMLYRLAHDNPQRRFLAVEGAYGSQERPPSNVNNVDWQPQTARIARDVFTRTRILLVPSVYESWGRAACEAMCSGIPVIASPTPGLLEALGTAGIFCDPDDPRAWQVALQDLDDPDRYTEASTAALARASELEALGRLDLGRLDVLVRLAAGGTRIRTGATMPTHRHDPFRHPKPTDPVDTPRSATGGLFGESFTAYDVAPDGKIVRLEAGTLDIGSWCPTHGMHGVSVPPGEEPPSDWMACPECGFRSEATEGQDAPSDDTTAPDAASAHVGPDPATLSAVSNLAAYLWGDSDNFRWLGVLDALPDGAEARDACKVADVVWVALTDGNWATWPKGVMDRHPGPDESDRPWVIPSRASDIVVALRAADPPHAVEMAGLVMAAEADRTVPRQSVVAACAAILG